ncbi:hypothetical protein BS78_08G021700 [Paspalum vaginatum]|nr:hypothetical protein BS78_08G021700 [Paspalum vaginatum]
MGPGVRFSSSSCHGELIFITALAACSHFVRHGGPWPRDVPKHVTTGLSQRRLASQTRPTASLAQWSQERGRCPRGAASRSAPAAPEHPDRRDCSGAAALARAQRARAGAGRGRGRGGGGRSVAGRGAAVGMPARRAGGDAFARGDAALWPGAVKAALRARARAHGPMRARSVGTAHGTVMNFVTIFSCIFY